MKVVAGDKIGLDRVARHENGSGPSGINWTSVAASIQARGGLARRDVDEVWPSKYRDDEAVSSGTNASESAVVAGPSGINASGAILVGSNK